MKRVVQVSSYYPPHLGGQEHAVSDLAKQLAASGVQVRVITSAVGGGPRGVSRENGLYVQRLWGFVFGHAPIMPWFPITLARTTGATTVVHVHIGQAFTPEMVWLVAKLRHFPYIAQLHIDFEPSGPVGFLLPLYKRFILKRVLKDAAAVITLNYKTLKIVQEVYGYTGRAIIMNNGIEEAYFTLKRPPLSPRPPRPLRLLFVGRLSKQKNVPALLEALRLTKRAVQVDIVGEGDQQAHIERLLTKYKLTNVTLHGRLSREAVMKFYTSADALIMPSLYEAQPLVLLEAMAAGIPIIGTNVVGVADHISEIGIIVEPTPAGLAHGIEQYYAQYTQLPQMVKRGRHVAEKLRWRHTLKKYKALYETVV